MLLMVVVVMLLMVKFEFVFQVPEQDEEEMQCLVFVERKHVAYALNKLIVELCNWDVDLYFVRSHYVATACQTATGADVSNWLPSCFLCFDWSSTSI